MIRIEFSWAFIVMLKLKLQYFGHLMQRTDSLKRPWCCKRLKAGGEGDDRGWDGWMASPTQWTWVWAGSRSWWWTGKPAALQSMGSQRVRHDWVTEMNWTEHISRENHNLKTYMDPNVHSSTIQQDKEGTWVFTDRRMDKGFVCVCVCVYIYIYTHTVEYYSAIKRMK